MKTQIILKKIASSVFLITLLLFSHRKLPGTDFIAVFGIITIIVHAFMNLRLFGWVSVFLYPTTYLIASLCDTPINGIPNNFYIYWYFGYISLVAIAFVVEVMIAKTRKA